MRHLAQQYESIEAHSSKKHPLINSVPNSEVKRSVDLDAIEYHDSKEFISTQSTTILSKSTITDQEKVLLQSSEPITDQEKQRASFWAVENISLLARSTEHWNCMYDVEQPKVAVELLYSRWAKCLGNEDVLNNIRLLLSEKIGPHNLDQFKCSSYYDFHNKRSVKLYALQFLSKELSNFMLKNLKYENCLDLPESSDGDSNLDHPSILVQIILKLDESKKPTILRDYLNSVSFSRYTDASKYAGAMLSVNGRIYSLNHATLSDKFKTASSIYRIHHISYLMINKEGKEKTKLALYRSMWKYKTIKWEEIFEEVKNLTPEQTELEIERYEGEETTPTPSPKFLDDHPIEQPYNGGSVVEEISTSQQFTSGENDYDNRKHQYEAETPNSNGHRKRHHLDEDRDPPRRRRGGWITDTPSERVRNLSKGSMCEFCSIRHSKRRHPIDTRREPFTPLKRFIENDQICEVFYRHGTDRLSNMLYDYLLHDETNEELRRTYLGKFES
ncbi:unnamed protein product [Ambrosiozyma monospora]|uniref:Unnamed protein product n=1 Tax=Ambrosiozyma monospora TaxID=43982 RepID=A0ACB5SWA7_AMBMO|nr:unnamed protein product [Ambrosiozyma monospora]